MWRIKFLSTPSARRATFAVTAKRRKGNKFLSTPSARRATFWWADVPRICIEFLSTPSARRATEGGEYSRAGEWISIHALREEGDVPCDGVCQTIEGISIHALREEGDNYVFCSWLAGKNFYPRPPRGGRHTSCRVLRASSYFYPRPPRGGRLPALYESCLTLDISIHALREEGDVSCLVSCWESL